MAKKSSVQVTATVTGDGISNTYAPAPTVNATAAPGAGPFLKVCAAGNTVFTPPSVTTIGVLITPDAATPAPVLQDSAALGAIPLAPGQTTFLALVAPSAGFQLNCGVTTNVFIQWV